MQALAKFKPIKMILMLFGIHLVAVLLLIIPVQNKLKFEGNIDYIQIDRDIKAGSSIKQNYLNPILDVYTKAVLPLIIEPIHTATLDLTRLEHWSHIGYKDQMYKKDTQIVRLILSKKELTYIQKIAINANTQGEKLANLTMNLKASLKGLNFKITKPEELQRIREDGPTVWSWEIQPTKLGNLNLNITLSSLIKNVPEIRLNKNIKIKVEEYNSISNIVNRFLLAVNPLLIFMTAVLGIFATIRSFIFPKIN